MAVQAHKTSFYLLNTV